MCYHKIILPSLLGIILYGCATTYAPDDWLPETEDIQVQAFGGWITVVVDENDNWIQYSGEFIGQDDKNVYVLYDSIYILRKKFVQSFVLELDQKNISLYAGWAAAGILITPFANGALSIISEPIWLIGGISAASGESTRDRFEIELPANIDWQIINNFARFPQGLDDIDLNIVRPKINFEIVDYE
jgi:hypothetical protein